MKAKLPPPEAMPNVRCFHHAEAVLLLHFKMKIKLTRAILCQEY